MNRKATDGKELEQYYAKNGNQLIVLYGRKDCKKEELLRSFVQDKKCFYYRCRQTTRTGSRQGWHENSLFRIFRKNPPAGRNGRFLRWGKLRKPDNKPRRW